MSLDLSYHKEPEYILFRDGDLNGFRDMRSLMKWKGWGMPLGDPKSMSLDAAYHKEHEYIWFRDGDLNGF